MKVDSIKSISFEGQHSVPQFQNYNYNNPQAENIPIVTYRQSYTQPQEKKSTMQKIINWTGIISLTSIGAYFGCNKLFITKNLKNIAQKVEKPVQDLLKKSISKYSLNSQRIITQELVDNYNLNATNSNKMTEFLTEIVKNNKFKEQSILSEIKDIIWCAV